MTYDELVLAERAGRSVRTPYGIGRIIDIGRKTTFVRFGGDGTITRELCNDDIVLPQTISELMYEAGWYGE